MPISAALKTKVEKIITDLRDNIAAKQTAYFTANGEYWQGILTPTTIPKDGIQGSIDKTKKATDHNSWGDFGVTVPATSECSIAIAAYSGPSGKGYLVEGVVEETKIKYSRCLNVGPDTALEKDWDV